jgi:hypothetical protein
LAAGLAAILLVAGFSVTQLQARVHNGSLTLGFGQLPPQAPEIDPEELKAEIQQLFDKRLLAAEQAWLQQVKAEIETASTSLSETQQNRLQAAVGRLESRFEQRLNHQTVLLTNDLNRSANSIYQTLAHEHRLDFSSLNDRLDLMSVTSQIEGSQRDAMVSTLIQFADLQLGEQSQ